MQPTDDRLKNINDQPMIITGLDWLNEKLQAYDRRQTIPTSITHFKLTLKRYTNFIHEDASTNCTALTK